MRSKEFNSNQYALPGITRIRKVALQMERPLCVELDETNIFEGISSQSCTLYGF